LSTFRCPSDPAATGAQTDYVMIVGERTVGGKPNETVQMSDVRDGLSNTIAVVEVSGLGIQWGEPKDLTVEEFLNLVGSSGTQKAGNHPGGFNVAMADGSVRFISNTTDRETIRRMLLRDDGMAAPF
jgi:prepilin-type processing-associated H-X9-DG protein